MSRKKFVERQMRLMPLGEMDSGEDPSGGGEVEELCEDRWEGVMREITRIVVRKHFVGRRDPVLEADAWGS